MLSLSLNQVLYTDVHVRHLHITNTHTHIPCAFHIGYVAFGSFNRPLSAICPWRCQWSTRISVSTSWKVFMFFSASSDLIVRGFLFWANRLQKWYYNTLLLNVEIVMIKKTQAVTWPRSNGCDLPIIELKKSLFQPCFRSGSLLSNLCFAPKIVPKLPKKPEQKSLSLAESLGFLHKFYQPLSIFDQNPASTKDMT